MNDGKAPVWVPPTALQQATGKRKLEENGGGPAPPKKTTLSGSRTLDTLARPSGTGLGGAGLLPSVGARMPTSTSYAAAAASSSLSNDLASALQSTVGPAGGGVLRSSNGASSSGGAGDAAAAGAAAADGLGGKLQSPFERRMAEQAAAVAAASLGGSKAKAAASGGAGNTLVPVSLRPAAAPGSAPAAGGAAVAGATVAAASAETQQVLKGVMEGLALAQGDDGEGEEMWPPEGALSVPCMMHQRRALLWMTKREEMTPAGGILADDQGLGKTVSTLALILTRRAPSFKERNRELLQSTAPGGSIAPDARENGDDRKLVGGTLVVCPTSVLRQWAREMRDKVSPSSALSVLLYHGSGRTKSALDLARYDVVLTTYAIVGLEVPRMAGQGDSSGDLVAVGGGKGGPGGAAGSSGGAGSSGAENGGSGWTPPKSPAANKGALAGVAWWRVVLDEAQMIKNARTQVAGAVSGLDAKFRWALSGTPIQNSVDDLFSYFKFLRYAPYDRFEVFRQQVKDKVARSPKEGFQKLQAILGSVLLRRTKQTKIKGQPIVCLPAREQTLQAVSFSPSERAHYRSLEAECLEKFQEFRSSGTVASNYVNILWMLLRLRQACNHPQLAKPGGVGAAGGAAAVPAAALAAAQRLDPQRRVGLLAALDEGQAECPLCLDFPEDPMVSECRHLFCRQCIIEQVGAQGAAGATGGASVADNAGGFQCPQCRTVITAGEVHTAAALRAACSTAAAAAGTTSGRGGGGGGARGAGGRGGGGGRGRGRGKKDQGPAPVWVTSSKVDAAMRVLSTLRRRAGLGQPDAKQVASKARSSDAALGAALTPLPPPPPNPNHLAGDQMPEKAIVFSQWTTMLDLLEVPLRRQGFQYRRLDGTMSVTARERAIQDFQEMPEVTVMIMSLKAASLGLNLVCANHVMLLDLWWNPTVEEQAIDRCHRIGQTRAVQVMRFTVKGTVEDRILQLQERKRQLVATAFGEDGRGGARSRLTMDDLLSLFHS